MRAPAYLRKLTLPNGASTNDLSRALSRALELKYPPDVEGSPAKWFYPEAIYDTDFVYCYEEGYWRAPYTYDGVDAQVTGEPVRVKIQYVPVETPPTTAGTSTEMAAEEKAQKALAGLHAYTAKTTHLARAAEATRAVAKLQASLHPVKQ